MKTETHTGLCHKLWTLGAPECGRGRKGLPVQSLVSDFWAPDAGLTSVVLEAVQWGLHHNSNTFIHLKNNDLGALGKEASVSC